MAWQWLSEYYTHTVSRCGLTMIKLYTHTVSQCGMTIIKWVLHPHCVAVWHDNDQVIISPTLCHGVAWQWLSYTPTMCHGVACEKKFLPLYIRVTNNNKHRPRSDLRWFIENSPYFGRQKLCFYLLQLLHFGVTCDRNWMWTSEFHNSESTIYFGTPSNP